MIWIKQLEKQICLRIIVLSRLVARLAQ